MPRIPRSNLALENARRSGGSASRPVVEIAAIGDYLAEGAIAVNARRVVTYVNRIAVVLLGIPADALKGRDVMTVLASSADRTRRFARALGEVLEHGVEQVLTVNDADVPPPFNVDYCRLLPIADGGALILLGETMSPAVPEQLAKARALAGMFQSVNQSLEVERVVRLLARHAVDLLAGASARLLMLEDGDFVTASVAGLDADALGHRQKLHESFAGQAVETRRVVRTEDLAGLVAYRDIEAANASTGVTRIQAIAAPLQVGGRPIGAILVTTSAERRFTGHDEQLLLTLATHGAIALENARLYRAAAQTAGHAGMLAETARTLAHNATPESLYAGIARVVTDSLRADGFSIHTVDLAHEHIRLLQSQGLGAPDASDDAHAFWSARQDRAVRSALPDFVSDVDPAGELDAREANDVRSITVLPLMIEGRVGGVLTLRFRHRRAFEERERTLLVDFSTYVAIAIRNASLIGDLERRAELAEAAARIARAAHERERMLATALATMDQPVFVLSVDRRVLYANAAAVREYGYSLEELTSMSMDRLVASTVAPRSTANVSGTSANVVVAEHVHRRRDGSQFPAAVGLSFIRQDDGTAIGHVLSVRNLTDERRIAEQLRQSEKLAALGELVAGVAHELNNPLAGISAFAQLLLEEPLDDDQRESARLIKREADRAVGVIRDLLIFSRKAGPSSAPVDLNGLVQLTLRLRAYSLRSSGVDVETHLDLDLPEVAGDDQKLQQVILNLIVNAEYAMRRSTTRRLVIRTARENDNAIVEVSDTGTGMSAEALQRVFEPFFTTKPPGEGTGLGLSVSYGIVEAHGGIIAVDSAPGRGTTFRIVLPGRPTPERGREGPA